MTLGHLRQNLVAYVALAVALSTGTAYAATKIPDRSVTAKKLAPDSVTAAKIRTGAVRSTDIGRGAVGTFGLADGGVESVDIKDDSVVRADIAPGVVPLDADIFLSTTGQNPAAVPAGAGLNSFQFTLPRNGKLAIELFAGELGVDCAGGGQGQVGIYIDGAPQAGTLTDVPASAEAGAVQLVTNQFLNLGPHTLTTGEQCATGAYGPTVPAKRVTWTVHLLAR